MSLKRVAEGIHTFAKFSEEKQLDFNGWHLAIGGTFVLIDPPQATDETVNRIRNLGAPTRILLTNKDHRRAAPFFREVFGAPISISVLDRPLVDARIDETFAPGDVLLGGLEVIGIPDSKSVGECAFFWPERRALFLGDALIGKPPGALSLLPAEKFSDVNKARAGLSVLGALDVDMVLVGDGVSILEQGAQALRDFLSRAA
ncbi:MAG: hypothetical protein HYV07_12910 [Deltaproteobacteria bacterium]|nr:hypothetical protein [Deltaproteobacteria bacterium]